MPLTDVQCRNTKPPTDKAHIRLSDGGGLYLEIRKAGGRYWYWKFRYAGKEKRLLIGTYPELKPRDAREVRDDARKQLRKGMDPVQEKRLLKLQPYRDKENAFETIAREWHEKRKTQLSPEHAERVIRRLERDIFPWLGGKDINNIRPAELLATLRRIESRGVHDTTHRALQHCGQVFRYAVAQGIAERDITRDLDSEALAKSSRKHFASITDPKQVGPLLRAIDSLEASFPVQVAVKIAALTFVRPGELRNAVWVEFDLKKAEWRIPAERMKMNAPHLVPLCRQAVALLRELYPLTGRGQYVFPSIRTPARPMSENTVNAALRRMGYSKEQMTGHGFRHMASTLLNEQGWTPDAIERQLAHAPRDKVRATYNYAQHLPERRKMMQAWADYLDSLKRGAEVVPIRANQ